MLGSLSGGSVFTFAQASSIESTGRISLDDSSAPLLQHEDREQQYSSNVSFDLEYVASVILRLLLISSSQFRGGHNRTLAPSDL